jgi:hypothetical protein
MNEPEHLVHSQNQLGETPIWIPEEQASILGRLGGLNRQPGISQPTRLACR